MNEGCFLAIAALVILALASLVGFWEAVMVAHGENGLVCASSRPGLLRRCCASLRGITPVPVVTLLGPVQSSTDAHSFHLIRSHGHK